ncbi:SAM-dependent methyltransferase [Umezawaea sp.]|uniref:SAM-dependent methyltransferase n=1 Tax=Umezawaea sp. TaxID=1955258 RepID=UPI002ECFC4A3
MEDGVGLTALMVAAARAIETHRGDSLATDLYAEHFVRAAKASEGWPVREWDVPDGDANPLWGRLARYFGLRTRVFDDHLLRSTRAGARQVVLLGAGLDSRAFRLDWPPGVALFEVDREGVLDFKHEVLDGLRATPKLARKAVAVDLRDDWTGALARSGFNPALPTAWLAEGVLLFLPRTTEEELVSSVDRLSAPGSSAAFEAKLARELPDVHDDRLYASARRQIGLDLLALFDGGPRPDSAGELTARGWSTSDHTPYDFTDHHGRGPRPEPGDPLSGNRWVFAEKLSH